MALNSKYRQCMVFSGGGFRFGIYLGMYAAAQEANQTPDLVLASCGGAIAAALIHSVPDPKAQLAWLQSKEMFQFWSAITPGPGAAIHSSVWGVASRLLQRKPAPFFPDVFTDYLFLPPRHIPLPPASCEGSGPDVVLIGSRLLYSRAEVGQPRGTRKALEEIAFGGERMAALLGTFPAPLGQPQWGNSAVAQTVVPNTSMPLEDAVRISVSDMYYFACHPYGGHHFMGGVVDLFPLEIAKQLAHRVVMEFKAPFDQYLSRPAWRSMLGIDSNERLRQVHAQTADIWIDCSDMGLALAKQHLHKKMDWRRNKVVLLPPKSYDEFVSHMHAHWEFGYQRAREAFSRKTPANLATMRVVNHLNRHPQ